MSTKSERREAIRRKRRGHRVHQSFLRVTRALAERFKLQRRKQNVQIPD